MRWVLMCLLMSAQSIQAEFNPQNVALNCLICHESAQPTTDGAIPGLTELSADELQQALLDFKYDRRSATLMPRIAKGYSDAELQAVADWLAQ